MRRKGVKWKGRVNLFPATVTPNSKAPQAIAFNNSAVDVLVWKIHVWQVSVIT